MLFYEKKNVASSFYDFVIRKIRRYNAYKFSRKQWKREQRQDIRFSLNYS